MQSNSISNRSYIKSFVVLFSHYSSTELSKEQLFLVEILQPAFQGLGEDVIHFFVLNKAIHGMFFGSLVTINKPSSSSRSCRLFVSNHLFLIFCIHFIALSIILQSLSLCIFTKSSWLTINFKTENVSRLITQYYAFTICVDQVNFLREKFGVSAYSRDQLVAD